MRPSEGIYSWILQFARGSTELIPPFSNLRPPLIHALGFPEHRIVITAHEDRADSYETGAAMRRLEVVHQYFIAKSIEEDRLELLTHAEHCCTGEAKYPREIESYRRSSLIQIIPRMISLFPDIGGPFLSAREIVGMKSAWAVAFEGTDAHQELEDKYSTVEWKRMLGHETLREWIEAEGYHPYRG